MNTDYASINVRRGNVLGYIAISVMLCLKLGVTPPVLGTGGGATPTMSLTHWPFIIYVMYVHKIYKMYIICII